MLPIFVICDIHDSGVAKKSLGRKQCRTKEEALANPLRVYRNTAYKAWVVKYADESGLQPAGWKLPFDCEMGSDSPHPKSDSDPAPCIDTSPHGGDSYSDLDWIPI